MAGSSNHEAQSMQQPQQQPDRFNTLQAERTKRLQQRESELSIIDKANPNNVDHEGYNKELESLFRQIYSESGVSIVVREDEDLFGAIQCALRIPRGTCGLSEPEPWSQIFKAIYFRAWIQKRIFGVFMLLYNQGLISLVGLETPMEICHYLHDEIRELTVALESAFEELKKLTSDHHFKRFFTDQFGYGEPLRWLATLIVRGSTTRDLWCLIDRINIFGEFGDVDVETLVELWPQDRLLNIDPTAGVDFAISKTLPGGSPVICYFLPYQLGPVEDFHVVYKAFYNEWFISIATLFFRYFRLHLQQGMPNESLPCAYVENAILKEV